MFGQIARHDDEIESGSCIDLIHGQLKVFRTDRSR